MAWYDRDWVSDSLGRKSERDRAILDRRAQTWAEVGGIADDVQARVWEHEDRKWEREERAMDRRSRDANTRYMFKLGDLYEKQLAEADQRIESDAAYDRKVAEYRIGEEDADGNPTVNSPARALDLFYNDPDTSTADRAKILTEKQGLSVISRNELLERVDTEERSRESIFRNMDAITSAKNDGEASELLLGNIDKVNEALAALDQPPLRNNGKGEDGKIDLDYLETVAVRNAAAQRRNTAHMMVISAADRNRGLTQTESGKMLGTLAGAYAVIVHDEASFLEAKGDAESMFGVEWSDRWFPETYDPDTFTDYMNALSGDLSAGPGGGERPAWSNQDLYWLDKFGMPTNSDDDQLEDMKADLIRTDPSTFRAWSREWSDINQDAPSGSTFNENAFRTQGIEDEQEMIKMVGQTLISTEHQSNLNPNDTLMVNPGQDFPASIFLSPNQIDRLEDAGQEMIRNDPNSPTGEVVWRVSDDFETNPATRDFQFYSDEQLGRMATEQQENTLKAFNLPFDRTYLAGLYEDIDELTREIHIQNELSKPEYDNQTEDEYQDAANNIARDWNSMDGETRRRRLSEQIVGLPDQESVIDFVINPGLLDERDFGIELGSSLARLARSSRDPNIVRALLESLRQTRSGSTGRSIFGLSPSEFSAGVN